MSSEQEQSMKTHVHPNPKPHAVFIPYPAQGHINPILKLAKLLHRCHGFHVTFVHTEYNHRRLLRSRGPDSLLGLPGFRFETIPDGLPPTPEDASDDVTQDIPSLCDSTSRTCTAPFISLVRRLNAEEGGPPVSCVVFDGAMSFALDAAEEFGVPGVAYWTPSACGVLAYSYYHKLVEKGLSPLKDSSYLTNGYLDTVVDWIPGMKKNICLRDLPSFIRTTDPNDVMVNYVIGEIQRTSQKSSALVLNTFDKLEKDVLDALSAIFPSVYAIGPINLMLDRVSDEDLDSIGSNLWKEENWCLHWLDSQDLGSVIYVNFGSITVATKEQITEFAWGLADSKKPFLWVIRPDLVIGESAVLPPGFGDATEGRGILSGWCPQELVLKHPSIGGFLTHCGWNSMMESVCSGVPVICWPFFAEQQTNCWYGKNAWGIGMEIDNEVKRDEVEGMVRELMDGEKGKEMKRRAAEWKAAAEEAAAPGGSSHQNLEKLVALLLSEQ
uniref:Glycosyltransferase n=1 Tax=Miconia microphysca TaxID=3021300 RepID=A0AA50KIB1_9MYRT|nr:UGT85A123 [Miconia microphysca]